MDAQSGWKKVKVVSQMIDILTKMEPAEDPLGSEGQYTTANGKRRNPFQRKRRQPSADPLFPDRLKVFIGTWNMYGRLLPIDLSTFLTRHSPNDRSARVPHLDGSTTHPYHILAIGTQECERDISEALFFPSKEVWEQRLSEHLGADYKLVASETLAALHLAVFVWDPVYHHVRAVQSERIKTGWANMIGNKGAVAISLQFGSRSLLFINCHLRAHQTKIEERNANVHRILHELEMDGSCASTGSAKHVNHHQHQHHHHSRRRFKHFRSADRVKESDTRMNDENNSCVTQRFDHVFLFGDTNYRLNADRKKVLEAIAAKKYKTLLAHDQLLSERMQGRGPLAKFKEHPIEFPPTYKLDTIPTPSTTDHESSSATSTVCRTPDTPTTHLAPSELRYDTSPKQRIPSWTDRILWYDRPREQVHPPSPPEDPRMWSRILKRNKQTTKNVYDTVCWWYSAVLDKSLQGISDHMPVIGVYGIYFDEWKNTVEMPAPPRKLDAKERWAWLRRVLNTRVAH